MFFLCKNKNHTEKYKKYYTLGTIININGTVRWGGTIGFGYKSVD